MSAALAASMLAHHFGGKVYAKEFKFPAGTVAVQHKHNYDHLSILADGTVELEVDGVRSVHTGAACIPIKAGTHHGIRAITDATWYCIHAIDPEDLPEAEAERIDVIDASVIAPSNPDDMRKIGEGML